MNEARGRGWGVLGTRVAAIGLSIALGVSACGRDVVERRYPGSVGGGGEDPVSISASSAPWPMLGQGPRHQSRSLSTTPVATHRTWETDLGEPVHLSCVIASDGTIYAATEHGLHAISREGTVRWTVPIVFPKEEPPAPAIGIDDSVYLRNGSALDAFAPDGSLRWEAPFAHGVLSSPTVAPDGTIYVSEVGGGMVALSPSGKVLTTHAPSTEGRYSTPTVTADGRLTFMQVDTFGSEVWRLSSAGALAFTTKGVGAIYGFQAYPVAGNDDATYVSTDGALIAIDASGAQAWSHDRESNDMGPAVGADGTLYWSSGGLVTALDPDGSVQWTYDGGPKSASSSVSIAADGTLYAGGAHLITLSADGALLHVDDLGSPVATLIAVDADGTTVFGTQDGRLHAR